MGDSFFAPEGTPPPPHEPDAPPPLFEDLGKNLGLGVAKSGTFSAFLSGLADTLLLWVIKAVAFLVNKAAAIFVFFMGVAGTLSEEARTAIGLLTAGTLKELTGIEVPPGDVAGGGSGPGRQAAANKMGQAIVGTLFAGAQAKEGGGLVPSANSADSFLSMVMKLELNGWLEAWVTDGISAHFLEKFGELKDGLSRSLGFGRLARQVFRAPLKILVSDPYLALLNQKYRPRHWDEKVLMARLNRGAITRADLSGPLGNQGYTEAQIDELVRDSQKTLSMGDLEYLDRRGLLLEDFAKESLIAIGYPEGTADAIRDLWRDKRIQKYRDEMVKVGEAAYVAGNIGPDTFGAIVQQSGFDTEEQEWMTKVAELKVSVKTRHLSEGEILKGIEDGILNFNDLKAWALREGMNAQDEAVLELEEQFKLNQAAALAKVKRDTAKAKVEAANAKLETAKQKAAVAKAEAADAGLTAATAGTLVKEGIWTVSQYQAFLQTHGYGPNAVAASVELLQAQLHAAAVKTAAAGATRTDAALKGLNLAQIEKAVIEGIVTEQRLRDFLTHSGYSDEDAQIIIDLTEHELTAAQVKAAATKAAHAQGATKSISIPDLDRAVRLGLTTVDAYKAALQKAGFDAASIALLTGILQSQLAADKAIAAKSVTAAATPAAKGITIGQLEQEVLAGIRTIGDYGAALAAAGYGHQDQIDLTALLQLKLDQAKSTAVKKAAATKTLAAKGISLPAAERAVKLGIVPVSTYTALLKSLNYTADAVAVLTNTLIAELGAAKKAQTVVVAATKTLAAKHISLPDLERAVIAGVRTADDYAAAVKAAGYSAGDVGTLTQLLQLKVDQAAAAAAAHADAEGVATAKGISLGSEEAAVVAGIKSMEDYDALLFALGYDDVDRATLEALLQAKVDAKAAKASPEAPGGSAGGTTAASTGPGL